MWTEDETAYLRVSYGLVPTKEIAKRLNKTIYSVYKQIEKEKIKKNAQREYAVYYDDEFMFTGTIKECARELNVNFNTIKFYSTPAHKRRIAKQEGNRDVDRIILVDLGLWPKNEEEYHETLKQLNF